MYSGWKFNRKLNILFLFFCVSLTQIYKCGFHVNVLNWVFYSGCHKGHLQASTFSSSGTKTSSINFISVQEMHLTSSHTWAMAEELTLKLSLPWLNKSNNKKEQIQTNLLPPVGNGDRLLSS